MVIRVPLSKTRFLARIDNYPASVQIDPQPLLEATSQSVVLVETCSSQAASDLPSSKAAV